MRGNHHDAWVNGATDPVSGMARDARRGARRSARSRATAGGRGRTIVYAAWDGEEPGLLGSTEWAEHARRRAGARSCVVYMNSDSNSRGFFGAGGSARARAVRQPGGARRARSADAARRSLERDARPGDARGRRRAARRRPRRRAATCRSSRSARAATTRRSCSTSASPRSTSASAARSTTASTTRSTTASTTTGASCDPGFVYGVALAQVGGRLTAAPRRGRPAALRPRSGSPTPRPLRRRGAEARRQDARRRPRRRTAASARASTRRPGTPRRRGWCRQPKEPVPFLNFAPLDNAVGGAAGGGGRGTRRRSARGRAQDRCSPAAAAAYDQALMAIEHSLTRPQGLPGPAVVRAPGLRAGRLHRLRREDAAGGARGDRAAALGARPSSRSASSPRCCAAPPRPSTAPRRRWSRSEGAVTKTPARRSAAAAARRGRRGRAALPPARRRWRAPPAAPRRSRARPRSRRGPRRAAPRKVDDDAVAAIVRTLHELYPEAQTALLHENPLQLLIATILSAQSTDERSTRSPARCSRSTAPSTTSPPPTRRPSRSTSTRTGFFRNKTKSVLGAAKRLRDVYGGEVPRTMEELLTLPGVARKTANVVLGSAFGIAVGVVVDTHVTPPLLPPRPVAADRAGEDRAGPHPPHPARGVDLHRPRPHPARPRDLPGEQAALQPLRPRRVVPAQRRHRGGVSARPPASPLY